MSHYCRRQPYVTCTVETGFLCSQEPGLGICALSRLSQQGLPAWSCFRAGGGVGVLVEGLGSSAAPGVCRVSLGGQPHSFLHLPGEALSDMMALTSYPRIISYPRLEWKVHTL